MHRRIIVYLHKSGAYKNMVIEIIRKKRFINRDNYLRIQCRRVEKKKRNVKISYTLSGDG